MYNWEMLCLNEPNWLGFVLVWLIIIKQEVLESKRYILSGSSSLNNP